MPASRPPKPKLGNTRVTGKEQFYTPRDLALELLSSVRDLVPDFDRRPFLEPAGGSGAFLDAAAALGLTNLQSWDIEPHDSRVQRGSFLEAKLSIAGAVTVSNPPFGRNNALSIPFFNHAAAASDYIGFIVPRSWRKWSVTNRLDRNFWLVADRDLQLDYVDVDGKPLMARKRLNTCFQVWERRAELRPQVRVRDSGFVTKTTPADADVALTVFGFGCGTVRTDFERKPNTTRLYLKVNQPGVLKALQQIDYSRFFRNTAYTEALSLQEVNFLLNEYLTGDGQLESKD